MHLYLVDGSSYIFRAYHALPPLTRPSDGLPVGAISGFCRMLWKLLEDTTARDAPTHFAVIFDAKRENFRNEIYKDYKANRPPAPEDLVPQFPYIKKAVEAFNLPAIEMEGYEADDLIATYASQARDKGWHVVIVSSDKDLMQLVGGGVTMYDTMKSKHIGKEEVEAKFGLGPEHVIDIQALAGDSSDNVPGVPGIGVKTAAQLIDEFGDLESLLENAHTIKQNKRRENLIEFADQARLSKQLVTLKQDVPVTAVLDSLELQPTKAEPLMAFMAEMEFKTLAKSIGEKMKISVPIMEENIAAKKNGAAKQNGAPPSGTGETTKHAAHIAQQMHALPIDYKKYQTITSKEALQSYIDKAFDQGFIAVDTETNSLDALKAELFGISLSHTPGEACYIPLAHRQGAPEGELDLFSSVEKTGLVPSQLELEEALSMLKELFENPAVIKIGQNLKYDQSVLANYDLKLTPIDDTMLMSYVLDAGRGSHGMDALSEKHLGHKPLSYKEMVGSGKAQISFAEVEIEKATHYAAEDADVTLRLWKIFRQRLIEDQKMTVYSRLERPLVPVLTSMERGGIEVDRAVLAKLSGEFASSMEILEKEIHTLAGEPFNIASPKQMGEILFGKLDYPSSKKTKKTGAYATGAGVLEDLANHESLSEEERLLPKKILAWRQFAKLKSTYTDALPTFINEKTGRVHTSFVMAGTTTGRLASSDPNIQNIPIRTPEGRMIRTAFVATKGKKLISADYSQIELRILAHIADIPALKQAFHDGHDIHAMTASEMFGAPIEGMDPMLRRRAKAINFGIIYGISAFGLANQLGISRSEAGDYIKTYFKRFPQIHDYMEETKEQVRQTGYVETIFGRRVHYPEIKSKIVSRRNFVERAAINAPIQGSAADIIRRAMIRMEDGLAKAHLSDVKMLLQVHDELIFEVADDKVDQTISTVKAIMENACDPVLQLSIPLIVDANAADNWEEAH